MISILRFGAAVTSWICWVDEEDVVFFSHGLTSETYCCHMLSWCILIIIYFRVPKSLEGFQNIFLMIYLWFEYDFHLWLVYGFKLWLWFFYGLDMFFLWFWIWLWSWMSKLFFLKLISQSFSKDIQEIWLFIYLVKSLTS